MRTMTADMSGVCRKCKGERKVVADVRVKGGGTKKLEVTCPACGGSGRRLATK